jgi:osmotically inducible protein OsmC
MRIGDGMWEGPYSFASRFEAGPGTNPEELLGAAHAGCFSMAFAAILERAGHMPKQIATTAEVTLVKRESGFRIEAIRLITDADVPGIDDAAFQKAADDAKRGCPVSAALSDSITVTLEARRVR